MVDKIFCTKCGKSVRELCAYCWGCKSCNYDCKPHMKRVINTIVGKKKIKYSFL